MSDFEIYTTEVKASLKKHFDDNELPPTIKRALLSKQEILKLYIEGWHPRRTAEFILQKEQENARANRKKRLQRYADEKYRLALRDNPDLTKEQWAKDFMGSFLLSPAT
jgi:hypothetical protein